ncbi:hypothetical protein BD410DRAFT_783159 [Rickenella mellea]|uniref:Uncharacterized protein n=1 Tax=Rickenella mellea TaxID=50990 RepID=A0A4Y7QHV2_9AGAM|nr:hypothetical protein BD410DRAFT_783159 [Rickenella mellea]
MNPRIPAELTRRVQGSDFRCHLYQLGQANNTRPAKQRKAETVGGDSVKAYHIRLTSTSAMLLSTLVVRLLLHQSPSRVATHMSLCLVARPGTELWPRLYAKVQHYAKWAI